MSWLKSLLFKHTLNLFRLVFAPITRRCAFAFKWNQTTKAIAGLSASIFSMMALLSFFGSLEEPAALSEPETISPELGASDELSMEFGLDAALPLQEPGQELEARPDQVSSIRPTSVIRAVSVEQAVGTAQHEGSVYHAVGQQNAERRVVQVAGEYPVYLSREKQPVSQFQPVEEEGAAWLTGEIEEIDDVPANGAFRPFRN
ncbi:hypothetical protein [Gimesia fumaroli]|uniref:Uncharacterized protein n=1 Tax=Gimesia fumaroli TaxID=2527976 RepID=A0A518I6F2_9PLAN|nr:hypothetical protein [Gimesia fumaroli]QDV48655.1 hypothetical protein Enr17x_06680 [Gimesia fumaroli]